MYVLIRLLKNNLLSSSTPSTCHANHLDRLSFEAKWLPTNLPLTFSV